MDVIRAVEDIEALRVALDDACDALMTVAERGLALTARETGDTEQIAAVFSEILTLCSFQDLAGQRLARLSETIAGGRVDHRPDADLLDGPANKGGLDQAAADALFNDF